MLGMYRDSAAAGMRDSSTAVMGLDLEELGLGVTGVAQMKPDSATAKLLAAQAPPTDNSSTCPRRPT